MQALLESVLLAIGGAIAGLVVAIAAARLLLALAFQSAHFLPISTAPSLVVLGFAFMLAFVTGIIFGAAPAWFATRTNPADALRGSGRSTSDRSTFARKALLIVQATFIFGYAILDEATLSFLGVGPPPPAPSWGNMLSEARYLVRDAFWISFFPGLLIGIAVLSANILGDGIRDRYDPRRGE